MTTTMEWTAVFSECLFTTLFETIWIDWPGETIALARTCKILYAICHHRHIERNGLSIYDASLRLHAMRLDPTKACLWAYVRMISNPIDGFVDSTRCKPSKKHVTIPLPTYARCDRESILTYLSYVGYDRSIVNERDFRQSVVRTLEERLYGQTHTLARPLGAFWESMLDGFFHRLNGNADVPVTLQTSFDGTDFNKAMQYENVFWYRLYRYLETLRGMSQQYPTTHDVVSWDESGRGEDDFSDDDDWQPLDQRERYSIGNYDCYERFYYDDSEDEFRDALQHAIYANLPLPLTMSATRYLKRKFDPFVHLSIECAILPNEDRIAFRLMHLVPFETPEDRMQLTDRARLRRAVAHLEKRGYGTTKDDIRDWNVYIEQADEVSVHE